MTDPDIEAMVPNLRITDGWLESVGFKWHQLERQPNKHWLLWLGSAIPGFMHSIEDLGIELAPASWTNRHGQAIGDVDGWHCWLRADTSHRYSRFLHVRHLHWTCEVERLVQALTGQPWDPTFHRYGMVQRPEDANRIDFDDQRLDRQLQREIPWCDIEKDPSRGGALPEHLEAHEKSMKESKS